MAFCKNCGAQLEDGAKFCPACGATVEAAPKADESVQEKLANLNNTPDTTAEFDAKDISDNKVMAVLAYLSILVLIPLFAAKDSKFARYHTNQGLILFIVDIIVSALTFIPVIGWLLSLATLVLTIIGIVNAAQGKAKELPLIGKFKLLK